MNTYTFTQTLTKTGYASTLGIKTVVSTFTIVLIDGCLVAVLEPYFVGKHDLYSIISNKKLQYTILDYTDDVSFTYDPPEDPAKGRLLCSPRQYSLKVVKKDPETSSLARFSSGKETEYDFIELQKTKKIVYEQNPEKVNDILITYGSQDETDTGVHDIEIHVQLQNYPQIKHTTSFLRLTLYKQETDLRMLDYEYTLA